MASTSSARRALLSVLTAGAAVVAACTLGAGAAAAQPPRPADCTAGNLAGVASGVAASISVYLLTHPDVNALYTDLQGMPDEQKADVVRYFFAANRRRSPS